MTTENPPPNPETGSADTVPPVPKALVPGSVTAKVLARVWRGGQMTVVDSPPGAGKTELVATVVAHLAARAGLRVAVGTPTSAQGVSLVRRLTEQIDTREIDCRIKGSESLTKKRSDGKPCRVTVATLAKWKFLDRGGFDVLVVDEAYQSTHALFSTATAGFTQVLMVGDPGQIGPVVTVDTSIWQGQKDGPHLRAPEVLSDYADVERFALDTTWRLGPASAAAVAPIYKFSFASGADHRMCVSPDGELHSEIESIEIEQADAADSLEAMAAVADRVSALVGSTLVSLDGQRIATDGDLAVIVSRNSQVSILSGMLQQRSLADVTIGTADRLQGGEWPIVIALDPFVGSQSDSEHNTSIGRLCVMASRHTTHLSWIHDGSWTDMTTGRTAQARTNRAVRQALTATSIREPLPIQP